MQCKRCGSENVSIQMVQEQKLVTKRHNILWWLFVGWWWVPIKWIFLFFPALIFKIFGSKNQKLKTKKYKQAICQNCGESWKV
jgi:uncharacterized membrane protein YvbJ